MLYSTLILLLLFIFIYLFIFRIYCLLRLCHKTLHTLLSYWYSVFICNSRPQHVALFSSWEALAFSVGYAKGLCQVIMTSHMLPGHSSCLDPHHWPPLCPTLPIKGPWLILAPMPPQCTSSTATILRLCNRSDFSNATLNWPKYLGLSDSIAIGCLYPPGTTK